MYQSRIRNQKRGRQQRKREFVEIEDGQMYALVQDLLGNGRVNVFCEDAQVRVARIRGCMRKYSKKVLIERGDLVLVALREFGDDKVDLFHKYITEDISYLTRHGMLPEPILKKIQGGDTLGDEERARDDNYVVFMEDGDAAASAPVLGGVAAGSDEEGGESGSDADSFDIDAI
jgi:translation initiation factor 1A